MKGPFECPKYLAREKAEGVYQMAQMKVTPAEFAEKHARRTKAALEDMRKGIQAVTEAPGLAASKKADKMRTNLLDAIDSGKWARRVAAVTLDDWKTAMLDKGVARVPAGIDAARAKTEAFATQLLAFEEAALVKLNQMPDLTLEDSIARSAFWIREMSKFEFKR